MRGWLLFLVIASLCAGCVLAASTRMEHPETRDVQYCWQYLAAAGGVIVHNTGRDLACIAKWKAAGYVEAPNPSVSGSRPDDK